jgi:coenzyme F420 hydrogenase subunit beta
MKNLNIESVVLSGLCHGCGTCYAACPNTAISINKNDGLGLYLPAINKDRCNDCGVCVDVCPGHAIDFTELYDQVFARQPEDAWLGVHLNRYLSHATNDEIRSHSSSGGLATALLVFALEERIIDKAIVTRMNKERPLESEVIAAATKEDIVSAMGSKYCPVSVNMSLKSVLVEGCKFAIVGMPCHLHGLRKFEVRNSRLRNNIVFRIGLMCSNTATFLGTEYFLKKKGIDPRNVQKLSYRGKGWLGHIVVLLKDGTERLFPRGTDNKKDQAIHSAAFHQAFSHPRCLVCCDHTAEFSDVSLGDPRLPELLYEEKTGKSLVVTRSEAGESLFLRAVNAKAIVLDETLTIQRFYQGQNIEFKRDFNANIRARRLVGKPIPMYRTSKPSHVSLLSYSRVLFFLPSYFAHRRFLWPMFHFFVWFNKRVGRSIMIARAVFRKLRFDKSSPRDRKATRILMVGSALSNNFGGPSIMIGICKCLRKAIPEAELRILTDTEDLPEQAERYEDKYHVTRVNGIRARHKYLGLLQSFLWAKANKMGINLTRIFFSNPFLKEINKADVVMDTRGISQTDFFSHWRTHCEENIALMTAVNLGKPAIKYTQDMGPFLNRSNRITARYCLPKLDLIIARGIIVRELLKEIGISKNVKVLPDTAFLFDPAPVEKVDEILEREGLIGRPLIGVAASRQVDRRILKDGNKTQQNAYTLSLARIADYMIKKYQVNVIFIPNEVDRKVNDYDDIFVAKKVHDNMMHKKGTRILEESYDAEITKGLIARCELMVASRYHSVVAAFSMRVPTIVLGWGFKYDQLTEMVGQRSYLYNYESIDPAELELAVDRLWQERERVKDDLERIIPRIQDMVYSGGLFVKGIIGKSRSNQE